ncbi:MAG: isopeptide-forming domain-containing fimbrial protein [Ruminococcus sp.]|nr:isopeptide-forming domain-containing fimbrial protein [Ruminococcus sp.]
MFTQKGSFIMKKSRTFRKSFVAAIAALCLAAPLAVMPVQVETSYADDATSTATTTYKAYQIFEGTFANDSLGDIQWGADVNTEGLIDSIKGLEVGGTTPFVNVKEAKDVAEALGTENNSAIVKEFAKFIEQYIITEGGIEVQPGGDGVDADNGDGYYLVKTETVAEDDARTRFILEVMDDTIKFNPKKTIPSVVKKVQENTEINSDHRDYENYNDVADYNIGDSVPFLLEATLPSNETEFNEYVAYYLRFNDTLSAGFNAPAPENIKIFVDGKEVVYNVYNIHRDVTGNSIAITIEDVNALTGTGVSVEAGSKIAVMYNATLNANATIGLDGNTNSVNLEYSNNPNVSYNPTTNGPKDVTEEEADNDGEVKENETTPETPDVLDNNPDDGKDTSEDNTGKTKDDTVIVFTYELDITKTFQQSGGEYNNATAGDAKFKIKNKDGQYAIVVDNKITGWDGNGTDVGTDGSGLVKFKGLDAGTYTIVETDTLAGYNKILDKDIVIAATMITDRQAWTSNDANEALTALTIDGVATTTLSEGIVGLEIQNNRGSSLPSTGGIGTTIFYLGGGTMAAVAGVYLITKKRMKNEEDDEI